MKLAYVIAPYRANTVFGIQKNIQIAEDIAAQLWRFGFAVICPHKNSANFDGLVPDETFLDGDIEILRRCDFAVCGGEHAMSIGCKREKEFCIRNKIPLYYSIQEAAENETA